MIPQAQRHLSLQIYQPTVMDVCLTKDTLKVAWQHIVIYVVKHALSIFMRFTNAGDV